MEEATNARADDPTTGHVLLNKIKAAQAAFRQAGDEAVVLVADADSQQDLQNFVTGTGNDISVMATAKMQTLAGSVLDGFLPGLRTVVHEVGQIASGASAHAHWGLGCEDHSNAGICKHYVDHLKEHMPEISVKATAFMQDCVL